MGIYIKDILCAMPAEDGEGYSVETHSIYVNKNKIAGIDEIPVGFTMTTTIDGKNRLLIPGLINSHAHNYMTLFRNCADDLGFDDWLFRHILPLEDQLTGEDTYWGSLLAIVEMIKSGTTCFCDMHMFINQTSRAVNASGIRAVLSRGLVGEDRHDKEALRRIDEAKEDMNLWKNHERMSFMLAPHAPYTCGEDYLKFIAEQAKELNCGINIHLSESKKEFDDMMASRKCTPTEFINSTGLFENKTIAAHCVQMTENDMQILAEKKVSVVTNPVSNMKLGNGFAPVPKMMAHGINVCLGTDGPASNNSLSMFHEMNHAALVHKGATLDAKAVTAEEVLAMATKNGAKALGLGDEIGEIKVGMKADLTVLNINREHFMPRTNLISALAYSTTCGDVDTVIIDGAVLMDKKELKTIDQEHVYYSVNKIAERLGLKR